MADLVDLHGRDRKPEHVAGHHQLLFDLLDLVAGSEPAMGLRGPVQRWRHGFCGAWRFGGGLSFARACW